MAVDANMKLLVLDLSKANDPRQKTELLEQLHHALFHIGFLYIKNHGVDSNTISNLNSLLPTLFNQPPEAKAALSKMNSPHFLGYSGYAEETTLGVKDLREQFDFATELPVIYDPNASQNHSSFAMRIGSEGLFETVLASPWPQSVAIGGSCSRLLQSIHRIP